MTKSVYIIKVKKHNGSIFWISKFDVVNDFFEIHPNKMESVVFENKGLATLISETFRFVFPDIESTEVISVEVSIHITANIKED
jgi:hypothetical protein